MTTASAEPVLIDTSVWVEYFRKKQPFFDRVEGIMEEGRVCTARFIVAEILQGARSETEFRTLQTATEIFHLLEERPETWIEAARLSSHMRGDGRPVGLGDCYIAVLAHQHDVGLLTLDKHFQFIQKRLKITLA